MPLPPPPGPGINGPPRQPPAAFAAECLRRRRGPFMRVLAIGDIHGCRLALAGLLDVVRLQPEDRLVFLGDYIDRGPDSRGVLDTLLTLQRRHDVVCLRGNHESLLLLARDNFMAELHWRQCGGNQTLASYSLGPEADWPARLPAAHWAFLDRTAPYFETEDHIFVHAGLHPDLDLAEQSEEFLQWEHFPSLRPHKSGKRIVCGHTAQRTMTINDAGHAVCIDTGPAFGGWLTCFATGTGQFWQARENGDIRQGVLPPSPRAPTRPPQAPVS